MASLRNESDRGRNGWRLQFYVNKKRCSIWLGGIAEYQASEAKAHIEHLVVSARGQRPPELATANWLGAIDDELRDKLAGCGLIESTAKREKRSLSLGEWLDEYIAEQADSAYINSLRNSDFAKDRLNKAIVYYWDNGKVFADSPDKLLQKTGDKAYQMWADLKPHMAAAKNELLIISPYFVPGKAGVDFLIGLKEKGVKIRILTNSLASTDVSVVHAGYARYRKPLLRAGIELYELNKKTAKSSRQAYKQGKIGISETSLHAKTFIIDRERVFIGSLNLDARSVVQNTEIGVLIDSKEIANLMSTEINKNIDRAAFRVGLDVDADGSEHTTWTGLIDGEQTTLTTEPYTGFWKRFGTSFMRLMPIESQI